MDIPIYSKSVRPLLDPLTVSIRILLAEELTLLTSISEIELVINLPPLPLCE
jgi:hypothetical protein